MLKGAIVGAIALTMGSGSFARAETLGAPQDRAQQQVQSAPYSGALIKEAHIARLRSALNLTPSQQPYWLPVEAALRKLARAQAMEDSPAGMVQRMSHKAQTLAGTAVQLRRLASAAAPLIRVLDESQKRNAMSFASSAGFGHLASAF